MLELIIVCRLAHGGRSAAWLEEVKNAKEGSVFCYSTSLVKGLMC